MGSFGARLVVRETSAVSDRIDHPYPVSGLLCIRKPFGVNFAISSEILDAFAGDLDEVPDASSGGGLLDELRIHDLASLRLAGRSLNLNEREDLGDCYALMTHRHHARSANPMLSKCSPCGFSRHGSAQRRPLLGTRQPCQSESFPPPTRWRIPSLRLSDCCSLLFLLTWFVRLDASCSFCRDPSR